MLKITHQRPSRGLVQTTCLCKCNRYAHQRSLCGTCGRVQPVRAPVHVTPPLLLISLKINSVTPRHMRSEWRSRSAISAAQIRCVTISCSATSASTGTALRSTRQPVSSSMLQGRCADANTSVQRRAQDMGMMQVLKAYLGYVLVCVLCVLLTASLPHEVVFQPKGNAEHGLPFG